MDETKRQAETPVFGCAAADDTAGPAKSQKAVSLEPLSGGTGVFVSKAHRFGTDALLLADFCGVRRAERACDLGTGCGIIPLYWHDRGHRGPCAAVELQPEACALLSAALERGGLGHIRAVNGDLRLFSADRPFDVVCCNPPFFAGGPVSPRAERRLSRHQVTCTTRDAAEAAARLLKDGGRFCLCQRPAALGQTMAELVAAGLQPKRLRFVRAHEGETPWLFLLDSRKNGGVGLTLLPDLITLRSDGGFTPEVLRIYGKAEGK